MTVKINLSTAASRASTGATLPVTFGQPDAANDPLTASPTNQVTAIAATSLNQVWEISPDVDILIAFGGTPDAGAAGARFLFAGIPRTFGVAEVGEKCAIKLPS